MKFWRYLRSELMSFLFWASSVPVIVIIIAAAFLAKTSYSWIFTVVCALTVREAVDRAYARGRQDALAKEHEPARRESL